MSYDPVAKQFNLLEHQGGPVDLIGVKNELLDRLYIPGIVEWLIELLVDMWKKRTYLIGYYYKRVLILANIGDLVITAKFCARY